MPRGFALFAAIVLLLPAPSDAHEIPTDVTVRIFLKPEGESLKMLVRVPLAAMRDMSVPTREQGYLDLEHAGPVLEDAAVLWIADYVRLYEGRRLLGQPRLLRARVSLPTNRAFEHYESALAHIESPPLPADTDIYWDQGILDVAFAYSIHSESSDFYINPGLERLGIRVVHVIRFLRPDGVVRAFDFPGNPGLIPLDPSFFEATSKFVELGFFHILDGVDHLLFLFCLVIPFRRLRSLVVIVTSFTIAHSITLIGSALGLAPDALWFPPLIETLIASSILYMAFENIAGANLKKRWILTFGFGLIHGFGFSFVLRQTMQFAGAHLTASLFAFNVGVELGQLLVLIVTIPALELLFRYVVKERIGTIFLSAIVAHSAWHWMAERAGQLRQFPFPALDAALLVAMMRFAMLAVLCAGGLWLWSVLKPSGERESTLEVKE